MCMCVLDLSCMCRARRLLCEMRAWMDISERNDMCIRAHVHDVCVKPTKDTYINVESAHTNSGGDREERQSAGVCVCMS